MAIVSDSHNDFDGDDSAGVRDRDRGSPVGSVLPEERLVAVLVSEPPEFIA